MSGAKFELCHRVEKSQRNALSFWVGKMTKNALMTDWD